MLEVAENVGERQHSVPRQHVSEYVGHGHVGDGTADAVVLVQQVKDDDLQFRLVVFCEAISSFDIPQPEVLVKALRKSPVERMSHIISHKNFSVLRREIEADVGFLLVVVVVQILLETRIDNVVSSGGLNGEIHVFADVGAEGHALPERQVIVDVIISIDYPWRTVEADPGIGVELGFDLFDRSAIGEEEAASPVAFQVDGLGDLSA